MILNPYKRIAAKIGKTAQKRSPTAAQAPYQKLLNQGTPVQQRRNAILGEEAYNRQMRSNIKAGLFLGAGAILYPSTGQTGPNQGTFARRGVQNRRTVGISSGAIQNLHSTSMYNSIGGM